MLQFMLQSHGNESRAAASGAPTLSEDAYSILERLVQTDTHDAVRRAATKALSAVRASPPVPRALRTGLAANS